MERAGRGENILGGRLISINTYTLLRAFGLACCETMAGKTLYGKIVRRQINPLIGRGHGLWVIPIACSLRIGRVILTITSNLQSLQFTHISPFEPEGDNRTKWQISDLGEILFLLQSLKQCGARLGF